MFHKTNGTNGKVVPQGFDLALEKNTFSSFTPSKLGKTPIFRGFSWIFQTCVTFFWLMLHVIPVCHFEALTIVKKKNSGKKYIFQQNHPEL